MVKKRNERSDGHKRKKPRFRAGVLLVAASLLLALFSSFPMRAQAQERPAGNMNFPQTVALGGEPFGLRFVTEGAVVYRVLDGSPAQRAGVKKGDILLSLDGREISDARDVSAYYEKARGRSATLTVRREGKKLKLRLKAGKDEERLGVYFRNALSGIGTVSFYDPETGAFAGLGHGVCDSESGVLLPLCEATVSSVRLTGVTRGEKGAPGQLRGVFLPGKTGTLKVNSDKGVFGVLEQTPREPTLVTTAKASEAREGEAELCCTVEGDAPRRYAVVIEKLLKPGAGGKDFLIRVTDEKLLSLTGGIVQGMSGSPILQNGKLIAVITHVLVAEPAQGYAIAVERMLGEMT